MATVPHHLKNRHLFRVGFSFLRNFDSAFVPQAPMFLAYVSRLCFPRFVGMSVYINGGPYPGRRP